MFSNRVIVHSTLPLISSSRGKGSLSKSTTPDGGRSARISCGCRWSALNWTEPLNWCRCVCLWRENLLKNCQPSQKKKKKNASSVDTVLGWKNICTPTFRNTTLRVVRMWAQYTVPSVARYPHSYHLPPSPAPPTDTHSTHTHTHGHAARMVARVHVRAHTQQGERDVERATWWKDTSHTNTGCLCRERPFYSAGQCLCWLFFVCTFLGTKSNRKDEGGGVKKRSQTGMQSQPLTCSDLYKLSLHIS